MGDYEKFVEAFDAFIKSKNATNSIKFKYKYSSPHFPITIDYGKNIFDDPFHRTFD